MWKIMPLNLGTLNVTLASQICRHGVVHDVGRVVKQARPRIRNGDASGTIPLREARSSSWYISWTNTE